MSYAFTVESLDSIVSSGNELHHCLKWESIFVLPTWLKVWWQEFGAGAELYLSAFRERETIMGIAPLLVNEGVASFIGSADVCDYLDFVIARGRERDFFKVLLDNLRKKGIIKLDLRPLRPDSTVVTYLVSMAQERGYQVSCKPEDVSSELDLPSTWDEYLNILTVKQRHEVKRKLRRLEEAGNVRYHIVEDTSAVHEAMDTFLRMFRESRKDKAAFMTTRMESFFRSLARAMAEAKLLRLGILELNTLPVASVLCFDYNDRVYLYNSGYDPRFSSLSVGLLSKVLHLKDSIQKGKKKFDFLKGAEMYKYHLGGKEIPLLSCQVLLK